MFLMNEFTFEMDDLSNEVYFELPEVQILSEDQVEMFFSKIRKTSWFVRGNRTEGLMTIFDLFNVSLDWKSITMGSDWDTDVEVEHEIKLSIVWNDDQTDFEVEVV
jgi:hypothetical protein